MIKITCITVSYNCENIISSTIKSVLSQTFENFEYIIVDGKSEDETCSNIEKLLNEKCVFISEADKGIYDAMNKAIEIACGDYLIFMNAGDLFASNNSMRECVEKINSQDRIVYGFVERYRRFANDKNELIGSRQYSTTEYKKGRRYCHQAELIHREVFQNVGLYNLEYPIVADSELRIRAVKAGYTPRYIDVCVAKILADGVSSSEGQVIFDEMSLAVKKHYGFFAYLRYIASNMFHLRRKVN